MLKWLLGNSKWQMVKKNLWDREINRCPISITDRVKSMWQFQSHLTSLLFNCKVIVWAWTPFSMQFWTIIFKTAVIVFILKGKIFFLRFDISNSRLLFDLISCFSFFLQIFIFCYIISELGIISTHPCPHFLCATFRFSRKVIFVFILRNYMS